VADAVTASRRGHVTTLSAAWLAQAAQMAEGGVAKAAITLPSGGAAPSLLQSKLYRHPATGGTVPSYGIQMPFSTPASSTSNAQPVPGTDTGWVMPELAAAASEFISGPYRGSKGRLSLVATTGGAPEPSAVEVDLTVPPLWPLPPRLHSVVVAAEAADVDTLEERALGLTHVPIPVVKPADYKSSSHSTTSTAGTAPVRIDLGLPGHLQTNVAATASFLRYSGSVATAAAEAPSGGGGGMAKLDFEAAEAAGAEAAASGAAVSRPRRGSVDAPDTGTPGFTGVVSSTPAGGSGGTGGGPASSPAATGSAAAAARVDYADADHPEWNTIVLPAPVFASQHILIDADVKRTFGDIESRVRKAASVPGTGTAGDSSSSLATATPSAAHKPSSSDPAVAASAAGAESTSAAVADIFPTSYVSGTSDRHPHAAHCVAAASLQDAAFADDGAASPVPQHHGLHAAAVGDRVGSGGGAVPMEHDAVATATTVAVLRQRLRNVLLAYAAYDREVCINHHNITRFYAQ
jgi:hypothetical protein